MNFLKTPEGFNMIWLDYCGYHLASNQSDLTPLQEMFITKGRSKLYEMMNAPSDEEKKQLDKQKRQIKRYN